jgi:hypothetical protein
MLALFSKNVPITRTDQLPEMGPILGIKSVTVAKLMIMKGSDVEARPPMRTASVADPNAIGGVEQTTTPSLVLKLTSAGISIAEVEP